MSKKMTSVIGPPPMVNEETAGSPLRMDFPTAMKEIIRGRKVSRLAWNNLAIYVDIVDEYLTIHMVDGKTNALLLRVGDMFESDWVIVPGD